MNPLQVGDEISTFAETIARQLAVVLPNVVIALILLAVGWVLAGWAERAVGRLLARAEIEPTLHGVAGAVVRYGLLILVIVAALGQLGIQTTSVLAALGAIGLAIGLALQGTLSNIAAGIMLLWLRPFRVGDYIEAGDVAGTVKELGLFASQLHSWDGIYQFVPNAELWNTRIVNYSRLDRRLINLMFRVSYSDDIERGRDVLLSTAKADERILTEPAPECFVEELGDNAVVLAVRAWTLTSTYWPVRRALTERGKAELEAAGLSIPLPQRVVHKASGWRTANGS